MKLLKKEVFDINKVTVVGSPTITSDGVASGFSNSNYIRINQPTIDTTKPWEIKISFCTPTNQQEYSKGIFQLMGGDTSWNCLTFTTASKLYFGGKDINGVTFNFTTSNTLEFNTIYDCVVGWNGTKYYIKYKKATDDIYIESFVNKSVPLETSTSTKWIKIGLIFSFGDARYAWVGSIDLKQFSITVDGQLVFQPVKQTYLMEKRKEGFDPSKFTVVGSPTITEYGVASGFSGTSYLTYTPFQYSNSLEIYFAVTPNGNGKLDGILGSFESSTYRGMKLDNTSGNTFRLWLSSDGVNNDICNAKTGNATNLTNNVLNYFRLIWDGTTYKLQHSLDKKIWNDVIVVASSLKINTSYLWIIGGTSKTDRLYGALINGSIDLPSFSIIVDDKEVFTGAKVNYYAMR